MSRDGTDCRPRPRPPRRPVFATTGTAQALGPDGTDPVSVGATRILIGGALLALVAVATHKRSGPRWDRKAVAAAVVAVAVYQLAFFAAVADTGVAVGTVVALGSAPTLAGLFERIVGGRRPSTRWTAATALACAGVALLALAGGGADVSARRRARRHAPAARTRSTHSPPSGCWLPATLPRR